MSFSYFHLLILFNRKLFSSSGYFSFVWLITFRIETFSFSDHWRFRMLINWAQSQLSPRNKTPNCFLLKLNRTLFGLFYQFFRLDKVANIMTLDVMPWTLWTLCQAWQISEHVKTTILVAVNCKMTVKSVCKASFICGHWRPLASMNTLQSNLSILICKEKKLKIKWSKNCILYFIVMIILFLTLSK